MGEINSVGVESEGYSTPAYPYPTALVFGFPASSENTGSAGGAGPALLPCNLVRTHCCGFGWGMCSQALSLPTPRIRPGASDFLTS